MYAKWANLAQAHDMDLGPFLLHRLENGLALEEQLSDLRSMLARIENATRGAKGEAEGKAPDLGLFVELLLTLRQVAGPQKAKIAQGEVGRLGLKIWNPGED